MISDELNRELTPAELQKLADLLCDKGLDFWGFHNVWGSVQKNLPDGYSTMAELCCDYELAETLHSVGMLDAYMPSDDDEPEFEVYTVTFPKP
jgi:hypothetical protein